MNAHGHLARFLWSHLSIEEMRALVRALPPPELWPRLAHPDIPEAQARAVVELLRETGRIDDVLMTVLVEHLPAHHAGVVTLAAALGLASPAPPAPRARAKGPAQRLPVLVVTGTIGEQVPRVTDADIAVAMGEDKPDGTIRRIDVAQAGFVDGSPEDWARLRALLQREVGGFVEHRLDASCPGDAPVFALGPIPMLIALGAVLGNKAPTRIMQKYNWLESLWGWHDTPPPESGWLAPVARRKGRRTARTVGLLVSVSGQSDMASALRHLPKDAPVWEIRIVRPDRDQIRTEAQLDDFRQIYDRLVNDIVREHGHGVTVSLFPAVPVAIAVALGQTLIPKTMPCLDIYDFRPDVDPERRKTIPAWRHIGTLGPPPPPIGRS